MNRSLVLRRLCWKEFRQLWPLVLMLAVIGLLFQILISLSNPSHTDDLTRNLFFSGLPGLFAAGVGALLVGQERDTRTLYWMASLPILRQDIIRVKFFAAIVGLASVWIISFALYVISNSVSRIGQIVFPYEIDISYGILYSIFLLTVSFATAWAIRSTFVGLLALVGITLAYTLATNWVSLPKTSDVFTSVILILASAVALWFGWLAALRALAPTSPARFPQRAAEGTSFFDRSIVDRRTVQTPWSALIWQFAAQSRAMLFGLALLFFIPLLPFSFEPKQNDSQGLSGMGGLTGMGLVIAFVSVSWLGVVTFQGDNLHQRIRFLSDRGIPPKIIWLTRQTVPIGLLIVGILSMAIIAAYTLPWSRSGGQSQSIGLLVLITSGLMWTVYSVTQWMSQVIRSPVIAAILGPVVAGLSLAYGTFAFETLETPIWVMALATSVPMIASWRMTRHWMDFRIGKSFWFEHAGWLALAVLLPAIPFFIVYFTYPSMPRSEWATFSSDAYRTRPNNRQPIEIHLLTKRETFREVFGTESEMLGVPGMEDASIGDEVAGGAGGMLAIGEPSELNQLPEKATFTEERELQLAFIEQQLSAIDKTMPLSAYVVTKRLMGEAMLARAQMQESRTTEELLKRYQRTIRSILRIVQGARSSSNLKAQQVADQYEAWLVQELQSPGTDSFLGPELRAVAITQLGDKAGRQNARYRALVVDWAKSQATSRSTPDHTLGDYSIPTSGNGTRLISKRHVSTVAWRMKQYLKASDGEARNQAKEALAREWNVPATQFGSTATPYSMNPGSGAPWTNWFGDWEKQADAYSLGDASK